MTLHNTISSAIDGLWSMHESLDRHAFDEAVDLLHGGRVAVTGMGKSGHVARKVAATMASLGQPAFYLHPGEACHGDLGMISETDRMLMFSWSGDVPELAGVIEFCASQRLPLVGVTSNLLSMLGRAADVALVIPKAPEACRLNLAPTTSTTMQMVLGDALAIALSPEGFDRAAFKLRHPGGKL